MSSDVVDDVVFPQRQCVCVRVWHYKPASGAVNAMAVDLVDEIMFLRSGRVYVNGLSKQGHCNPCVVSARVDHQPSSLCGENGWTWLTTPLNSS